MARGGLAQGSGGHGGVWGISLRCTQCDGAADRDEEAALVVKHQQMLRGRSAGITGIEVNLSSG